MVPLISYISGILNTFLHVVHHCYTFNNCYEFTVVEKDVFWNILITVCAFLVSFWDRFSIFRMTCL